MYTFEAQTGIIDSVGAAKGVQNPSYLALSPDKSTLYAVNEMADSLETTVSSFARNSSDGSLQFINKQPSRGGAPCYVSTDKNGDVQFSANYLGGSFTMFPVNDDGSLAKPAATVEQSGSALDSDIIAGINYVISKASSNDGVNMSLGKPASNSIANAVISAADGGLRFSISAGNSKVSAISFSPGRVEHPNVWTVSAFKHGDNFAVSFDCNINQGSNFSGPTSAPIEYSLPGNNIPSLAIGGGTTIMCGTSMAAPHIAGLLLAAPNDVTTDGVVSNDPDNDPDPIAVYDLPLAVSVSGAESRGCRRTEYLDC